MPSTTEQTRAVVEAFAELFYRQGRVREAFETWVAPDYVQHNPNILDGRDAAIAALEPKFGSGDFLTTVHRTIVDGDLAMLHVHGRPAPGGAGGAVADIYRVSDGRIVEHWDILQPWPQDAVNPHPMF